MSTRQRGMTLIEMIVAIVIIGVGLAGVLLAFNTGLKSSADPMLRKQMLAIAEGMLEEILLKPYAAGPGTISGCNRANADDVSDYGSYTDQPVCDLDGNSIAALSGYRVTVSVDSSASLGSQASDVKMVTVTVNRGTESISLIGYRTDYAS